MTDYNFIRFTNRGSKLGNYRISINKSLSFGLLSGFYLKEGIKDYKKAVLFFDKTNKAIGISFTNDKEAEGAFTISHSKTSKNTGSISAHSFFVENELKQNQFLGQKVPRKMKDNKLGTLFVIDLLNK
ncbi:MAG: hypothetical protein NTU85_03115 [Candidatus Kaiserbacteria bacterium]|nr:hypothetical protein [Candidatus Kaiserbacteria bacterium]